jgi:hypothetical protein
LALDGYLALVDLTRKLRDTYGVNIAYNALWRAVIDGTLPAERIRNRWFVKTDDLPKIPALMGHPMPTAPSSAAPAVQPA